jgi:hypothetical protein
VASRWALRRSGFSDFLALSSSMERPWIPRVMAVEVTILFFAFLRTSSCFFFIFCQGELGSLSTDALQEKVSLLVAAPKLNPNPKCLIICSDAH